MLKLDTVSVGAFQANCYVLGCERTGEGLVIDPGAESSRVIALIEHMGVNVVAIVNTHAHVDHIGANEDVKNATGAGLMIHEADACFLNDSSRNLTLLSPISSKPGEPDRLLLEGDTVQVGDIVLKVIHTPGHTPGGICLYAEGILFTGDTLFAGSVGRTDLPGGDFKALMNSIETKIMVLPEETQVYPGHGPSTTIGREKEHNPFL